MHQVPPPQGSAASDTDLPQKDDYFSVDILHSFLSIISHMTLIDRIQNRSLLTRESRNMATTLPTSVL